MRKQNSYWNRNFTLFFLGSLISGLGGTLSSFTTSLFFLDMTGSAALMSAYLAWTMVIRLAITPLMGPVVDRLSKVKVMWVCDFIFGATDLIAAALLFSGLRGPAAAAVVFANGTINCLVGTMFNPASSSMTPLTVEKDQLTQAYSAFSTMQQAVNLFGVVFAAGLYTLLGYEWILLLNGLCVGGSGIAEMFICVEEPPSEFQPSHFWQDMKDGLRYIKNKPALLVLGGSAVPSNFFGTGFFSVILPFTINTALGLPAMVLAAGEIGLSAGSIVTSLLLSRSKRKIKPGRIIAPSMLSYAVDIALIFANCHLYGMGLYPMPVFTALQVLLFFAQGVSMILLNVPLNAAIAAQIEPDYMARVQALNGSLCNAATPLAAVVFGLLIDYVSLSFAQILTIAGFFGVFLMCHCFRHLYQDV